MRKINDIDAQSAELGVSVRDAAREHAPGVVVRDEHGRMPGARARCGLPAGFDNEYDQYGVGATVVWVPAGHSSFDGRLELRAPRVRAGSPSATTPAPSFRALYTWTPTAKFTMLTAIKRDVGPPEDIQTSFVLVTGAYVRPRLAWSPRRSRIQGNVEYAVWDYRGNPVSGDFRHRVRTFGGKARLPPDAQILLSAGMQPRGAHERPR